MVSDVGAMKKKEEPREYLDEHRGINLPRSFELIDIGTTEESKRKAIEKHDKRIVALSDKYFCVDKYYIAGRIFYDPQDQDCYRFRRVKDEVTRGEVLQLHFNDLEGLLAPVIV